MGGAEAGAELVIRDSSGANDEHAADPITRLYIPGRARICHAKRRMTQPLITTWKHNRSPMKDRCVLKLLTGMLAFPKDERP